MEIIFLKTQKILKVLFILIITLVIVLLHFEISTKDTKPVKNYTQNTEFFLSIDSDLYAYSAYCIDSKIIIIAIIKHGINDEYNCQLIDGNSIKAQLIVLPEHHETIYRAAQIICDIDDKRRQVFKSKSVQLIKHGFPSKSLKLEINYKSIHNSMSEPLKTLCIRPMFGSYATITSVIEFIAYYRIHGIDRIEFYNFDLPQNLLTVLKNKFSGFLTIRQFKYPFNQTLIHSEGQLAAMHDCLYRFYDNIVIFVDIDEFIIPYKHNTISELMEDYYNKRTNLGSLIISSVFFCNKYTDAVSSEKLKIFRNVRRDINPFRPGIRSKVVALRPQFIHILGVHFVWKYNCQNLENTKLFTNCEVVIGRVIGPEIESPEILIDMKEALIYHYNPYCDKSIGIITDKTIMKYKMSLYNFIDSYKLNEWFLKPNFS